MVLIHDCQILIDYLFQYLVIKQNVLMLFSYYHVYFPFSQICLLSLPETYQGLQSWSYSWTIEFQFLLHFDWRVSFNDAVSFSKVIVLSSALLYNDDFLIKLIRSFIDMLNSSGSWINPWGTPESSVLKVLYMLLLCKLTHCFLPFK